MKKLILLASLFLLFACADEDINVDANADQNGLKFLIGKTKGEQPGLYEFTYSNGKLSQNFVSEIMPSGAGLYSMDYSNGRVAMATRDSIMYASTSNYNFKAVPQIGAEDGYWWRINTYARPQVMKDGRVLYIISYETDNNYDDYSGGQIAIYDPKTDETVVTGELSEFVKSQPEKGGDTENGSTKGLICLSEDEQYIYFTSYGYGTNGGVYHVDYRFLTRYDMKNKTYKRIDATASAPVATSADGRYLYAYYTPTLTVYDLNDIDNISSQEFNISSMSSGQCAQVVGDEILLSVRASFIGLHNQNGLTKLVVQDDLDRSYRGIGYGLQANGSNLYFTLSADRYTNNDSGFDVMRINKDKPEELDSLFRVEENFRQSLFMLLK